MLTTADPLTYTPLGSNYRVKRVASREQTAGGIWLAETAQHVPDEAEILAAGPGLLIAGTDYRTGQQCGVGDRVIFGKYELQTMGAASAVSAMSAGAEAMVKDEDLVAVMDPESGAYESLGDWVKVEAPERIAQQGSIVVPEQLRTRARRARVLDCGPGPVRMEGSFLGRRVSIPAIVGLEEGESLIGSLVCWNPFARIADVRQPSGMACMFIKASDLFAILEPTDE